MTADFALGVGTLLAAMRLKRSAAKRRVPRRFVARPTDVNRSPSIGFCRIRVIARPRRTRTESNSLDRYRQPLLPNGIKLLLIPALPSTGIIADKCYR